MNRKCAGLSEFRNRFRVRAFTMLQNHIYYYLQSLVLDRHAVAMHSIQITEN